MGKDVVQTTKRRRRLGPKRVEKIRELLEESTPTAVAELLQMPYFQVYCIWKGITYKQAGGPVKRQRFRKKVAPDLAKRIVALSEKGAKVPQLAKAAKLSETTIKRILRVAQEAS